MSEFDVKRIRTKIGLTQKELAEKIGITQRAVQKGSLRKASFLRL